MLEKNFRRIAIAHLRDVYNAHVIGAEGLGVGTSDLLVCWNGKFIAIELKGSGSTYKETAAQILFLKKIRNAGGIAFTLKHSDDWKQELYDFLTEKKVYEIK